MKYPLYFLALGGGQQVGASCYFLKMGPHNILLDCGIGFKNGLVFAPNFSFLLQTKFIESLSQINQVFISHAHLDHIGGLPTLMKIIPNCPVFMTDVTKKLSQYQLYDKNFYKNFIEPEKETERLALKYLFDKIIVVSFLQSYNFKDLKVTFYPAGHIPGAMMILFEYHDKKILYTGDYSVNSTPLTDACLVPKEKIDVLIICALHARQDENHKNSKKSDGLTRTLNYIERILFSDHSVHCQIRQLSKGIEFLELLNDKIEKGLFPATQIYIDESIFQIIDRLGTSIKPLIKENVHSSRILSKSNGPHIFITTSSRIKFGYEFMNIDFSLHDDFESTLKFIKKINPNKAVLVHTASNDCDETDTIETQLLKDAESNINCIFAENEIIYQLA